MLITTYILIFAMYTPTVYRLFHMRFWLEEYSHAPLVILVFFWLLWRERKVFKKPLDNRLHTPGLLMFFLGLILYWYGVKHHVIFMETASIPFVVMGACFFLLGKAAMSWLFPAAYMLFIVPPPLFILDMITFPLKQLVSIQVTWILNLFNYPIIRNGVMLIVGDYKLLVADACSGMRSAIPMLALTSLYVYLQQAAMLRRFIVLASIVPIAIVANTVRVTALTLITYHYGEAAGQSFYHDFSGFVVFAFALTSIIFIDKLALLLIKPGNTST